MSSIALVLGMLAVGGVGYLILKEDDKEKDKKLLDKAKPGLLDSVLAASKVSGLGDVYETTESHELKDVYWDGVEEGLNDKRNGKPSNVNFYVTSPKAQRYFSNFKPSLATKLIEQFKKGYYFGYNNFKGITAGKIALNSAFTSISGCSSCVMHNR